MGYSVVVDPPAPVFVDQACCSREAAGRRQAHCGVLALDADDRDTRVAVRGWMPGTHVAGRPGAAAAAGSLAEDVTRHCLAKAAAQLVASRGAVVTDNRVGPALHGRPDRRSVRPLSTRAT